MQILDSEQSGEFIGFYDNLCFLLYLCPRFKVEREFRLSYHKGP